MPLWDNLRRQVEALPGVSTYDPVNDFLPMFDASEAAVAKIALKDMRSRDVFSVPMYSSRTFAPTVTTNTTPRRVFRAPWAITIERIYATCDVAGSGNTVFDVHKNSLSLWTGGSGLNTSITLASGVKVNSEVPTTTTLAEMDELRFHIQAANSAIRVPWLHVFFYRT